MSEKPLPLTTIDRCRWIRLETHPSDGGRLTVADNTSGLPFEVRRVFYIYDIPAGTTRGGHAHCVEEELLVALSGCFDVTVSDGSQWRTYTLRRADEALYLPAGVWIVLSNFSTGCVALAMSSTDFIESNYVRDYDEFLKLRGK